jgi:hypothetical protein
MKKIMTYPQKNFCGKKHTTPLGSINTWCGGYTFDNQIYQCNECRQLDYIEFAESACRDEFIEFLDNIITRLQCSVIFLSTNKPVVKIINSMQTKLKELQKQKEKKE